MSWDYAVVKKRDEKTGDFVYAVHEVFLDEEDRVWAATETPVTPMGESLRALTAELMEHVAAVAYQREDEVLDLEAVPQEGAVDPTKKVIEEVESGEAETVALDDVLAGWLEGTRDCVCARCRFWFDGLQTGDCRARPIGVRNRDFEQEWRYARTERTDWCSRFQER